MLIRDSPDRSGTALTLSGWRRGGRMVGKCGREEVVAVLLRGLKARPVVPRPAGGPAESHDRLLARIDTPGHAAVLDEDRYAELRRETSVVWRGVLSFIARADTPLAMR